MWGDMLDGMIRFTLATFGGVEYVLLSRIGKDGEGRTWYQAVRNLSAFPAQIVAIYFRDRDKFTDPCPPSPEQADQKDSD